MLLRKQQKEAMHKSQQYALLITGNSCTCLWARECGKEGVLAEVGECWLRLLEYLGEAERLRTLKNGLDYCLRAHLCIYLFAWLFIYFGIPLWLNVGKCQSPRLPLNPC